MRATRDLSFDEIILVDTEFRSPPGETPEPVCLVAHELWSGRRHRYWASELGSEPPFLTGSSTLVVAYYAVAELSFFLAMDWPMPAQCAHAAGNLSRACPQSNCSMRWPCAMRRSGRSVERRTLARRSIVWPFGQAAVSEDDQTTLV